MKYILLVFVTVVLTFLGATVYYKGLPTFSRLSGIPATSDVVSQTPLATSATQAVDENIAIASAIKVDLLAEHGSGAETLTVTISKIEGDYAEGMASAQGGGGQWYGAKVANDWKLVWDGNGQISCTNLAGYPGFPKDMIPECWDPANQIVVYR